MAEQLSHEPIRNLLLQSNASGRMLRVVTVDRCTYWGIVTQLGKDSVLLAAHEHADVPLSDVALSLAAIRSVEWLDDPVATVYNRFDRLIRTIGDNHSL